MGVYLAIRGKKKQPPLISFDESTMSGGTKARSDKTANEGNTRKQVTIIHCLILFCLKTDLISLEP